MKCPKCGSEKLTIEKRIDGYCHCIDCGWNWKPERKQPEPTTAEMLLWLAKNTNIGITKTCMFVNSETFAWDNGTAEILAKRGQKAIMVKELDEAIKFAYLKKQEEQNANRN